MSHYSFDIAVPKPREPLPEYLRNLPAGASAWIDKRHLRALRMHGRKRGWILRYQRSKPEDGHLVDRMEGQHGRVWRLQ